MGLSRDQRTRTRWIHPPPLKLGEKRFELLFKNGEKITQDAANFIEACERAEITDLKLDSLEQYAVNGVWQTVSPPPNDYADHREQLRLLPEK